MKKENKVNEDQNKETKENGLEYYTSKHKAPQLDFDPSPQ